jgi:hypothetical protein
MSALVFGKYRAASLAGYLGPMEDQTLFFATSEARRIKNEFINRARPRSAVSKIFRGRVPLAIEIVSPGSKDWMIGKAARKFVELPGASASRPFGFRVRTDPISLGNGAGVVGAQTQVQHHDLDKRADAQRRSGAIEADVSDERSGARPVIGTGEIGALMDETALLPHAQEVGFPFERVNQTRSSNQLFAATFTGASRPAQLSPSPSRWRGCAYLPGLCW